MTSKRVNAIRKEIDKEKIYTIHEAIGLLKTHANAKFVESIDVAIQTGIDPRKYTVRGVSVLPHGVGRPVRVAVFATGALAQVAKDAGAHAVGMEDLAQSMENGALDFGVVIATPEAMPLVGKLGKVLGPKGLMPNPKTNTVTTDIKQAVVNALNGQVTFRLDKAGIVHCSFGRVNFAEKHLIDNLARLVHDIRRAKPSAAKGAYIKQIALSTTMGAGVIIDINSIESGE